MNKTYAVTLKLVGEVKILDGDSPCDDVVDVASVRRDYGKVAEALCDSIDLDAMTPCHTVMARNVDETLRGLMIDLLHLARDMEQGRFRGMAFAEAVKSGVLAGGSLRGEVTPDLALELDRMGLRATSPLVPSSKIN